MNNVIVKYIYDGKVWLPMQDALELNVKKSCKDIKIANPYAKNGYYSIDPDGPDGVASVKVYCEMETDGGGWTEVFLAKTNNYNSTRIDYTTKNAKEIINNAKEMMFAFVDPITHTYQNQWKFSPIPKAFKTTTPMTRGNDTAGSGYATINATDAVYKTTKDNFVLRYGTASFGGYCDDKVIGTWGQLCLKLYRNKKVRGGVSGFPFYSGYATDHPDTCTTSEQRYDKSYCSDRKRFTILVR